MGKVITFDPFDTASVSAALQEVLDYKDEFEDKVSELRQRVGEEIEQDASAGFAAAIPDDIIQGPKSTFTPVNDVAVSLVDDDGTMTVVKADGRQTLFIEFGAGIYHNGAVGTSPNPWGKELGFTIGSYGEGYGRLKVWSFPVGGRKVLSRGTPAAMPMFKATENAKDNLEDLAQEVFG